MVIAEEDMNLVLDLGRVCPKHQDRNLVVVICFSFFKPNDQGNLLHCVQMNCRRSICSSSSDATPVLTATVYFSHDL